MKAAGASLKLLMSPMKKTASVISKAVDTISKKISNMWSMLMTRIKRRAIATIFNDIKGVFGQMAQINPEFNESVSGMVNSARQLGAQILAIVEPIITRLGPYITKMLDMLTAVADKVAQFMAKAFGYDKYSKAEKGNYDYAASVDETTDSTKKATKATKEYENTVMGFDQLNKLNGNNGSDTADDTEAKLEQMEAEANAFNHIGESIWEALSNHDYYGAGTAMAAAVNSAFGWLDNTFGWENNADKLTQKFQNLGDIINGFIDNLRAADIGHAFGNILNTAINGLDILMNDAEHGIHFEQLGENIGQMLITAVHTIHWDKLGSGLAGALTGISTALMTALTTTVENPDTHEQETLGQSLGSAVLKFLNGVNDKLDPEAIGGAIGSIIDTITGFFSKAFSDHQAWATLGAKLGKSLTEALNSMDREQMKEAIYNFCYSLGRMLGEFVKNVDWGAVLSALWDGIQAGVAGISDAVDDLLLGDMKTRESILDNKSLSAEDRAAMWQNVREGKKYANDSRFVYAEGHVDRNQLEDSRTRIQQLEDSIATYKGLIANDDLDAERYYMPKLEQLEKELAELLEADGVAANVEPVIVEHPMATTATTQTDTQSDGDTSKNKEPEKVVTTPVNVNYNGQNLFCFMLQQFKTYEKTYDALAVQ